MRVVDMCEGVRVFLCHCENKHTKDKNLDFFWGLFVNGRSHSSLLCFPFFVEFKNLPLILSLSLPLLSSFK